MNISIVGGGYVGMAWAQLLNINHKITIVDIDEKRVKEIQQYFNNNDDDIKILTVVFSEKHSYKNEDVVFVAVPTNFDSNTQQMDCSIVENVITQIIS